MQPGMGAGPHTVGGMRHATRGSRCGEVRRTCCRRVQVHGPRHESTAALLNDLGLLAFWREDWAEAEQHFK